MPSFAQKPRKDAARRAANASDRSHEYATLEHLLLALIDDPDAAEVMTACGVDLGELGEVVRSISIRNTSRSRPRKRAIRSPPPGSSG
jgi:ATP-dependent Clp protease ATP-binding subunit ClpA